MDWQSLEALIYLCAGGPPKPEVEVAGEGLPCTPFYADHRQKRSGGGERWGTRTPTSSGIPVCSLVYMAGRGSSEEGVWLWQATILNSS